MNDTPGAAAHQVPLGLGTVLYIGAHDVDFLVRAGGTLAKYAQAGSRVVSVSLTFGERQESERLWRERPGIDLDEVKQIRLKEAQACADLIGSELRILDWDDSPIEFGRSRLLDLARIIQEVQPRILITHAPNEVTNYDHYHTARAVQHAIQYASTAGTAAVNGLKACTDVALYFSEPSFPFPDTNEFRPNVWVDITDVYALKLEGLRTAWSHGRLDLSYPLCAKLRAYQAQLLSGDPKIEYAEAFFHEHPWVGTQLPFG